MRKLISKGVVVFAGVVSAPTPITHQFPASVPMAATVAITDPRLDILQDFFGRSAAPAAGLAHIFLQVSDTYGLDWRLLPSISWVESGGGRTARNNNLFGWDAGRAEFQSMAAAIQAVAYCLANSNLYKHKSLDEILATYNPNEEYAGKVKSVMRSIAPPGMFSPRLPAETPAR